MPKCEVRSQVLVRGHSEWKENLGIMSSGSSLPSKHDKYEQVNSHSICFLIYRPEKSGRWLPQWIQKWDPIFLSQVCDSKAWGNSWHIARVNNICHSMSGYIAFLKNMQTPFLMRAYLFPYNKGRVSSEAKLNPFTYWSYLEKPGKWQQAPPLLTSGNCKSGSKESQQCRHTAQSPWGAPTCPKIKTRTFHGSQSPAWSTHIFPPSLCSSLILLSSLILHHPLLP
jgi:hypothetical protein